MSSRRCVCGVACRAGLTVAVLSIAAPASLAIDTGPTGGDQPFSTRQPTLGLNYVIHERGSIGEIRLFPYATPGQWIRASGQLVPIAQFGPLADELGTAFGGDGMTSVALPDLDDRLPVGVGMGPQLTNRTRGEQFGSESIMLTVDQIPSHVHGLMGGGMTGMTGGGMGHSTIQPSLGLRFGVTTDSDEFPPNARGALPPGTPANPYLGQFRLFAGMTLPADVHEADGENLIISQNTALFSLLGTTFGGNGQTTFGLPDFRGRTPIGTGQGPGLSDYEHGQVAGHENITLTEAMMPFHNHTIPPEVGGGVTDPTGGSQPIDNLQPSLAINFIIRLQGTVPTNTGLDAATAYLGEIAMWGASFAPQGWAFCQGQFLPINQNSDLYQLIGTTYGGNGTTTFALPDLRGRAPEGADVGRSMLGEKLGTETVTLTVNNLPSHVHEIPSAPVAGLLAVTMGIGLARRRR